MTITDAVTWQPSREHFKWQLNVPFIHDDATSVDYYLAVEDGRLFCVFQGSQQRKDWIDDFTFWPKKFDIYPGSNILVHEGIAKQYLGMRNKFLDLAYRDDVNEILICGFSLGGGLSQLVCEDAMWHFQNPDPSKQEVYRKWIKSISYEGPRVFYPNEGVKNLIANHQVLVKTWWDPVPHLPLKIMGLQDYGKVAWIGKWNRPWPLQHYPDQVEKNLFEKYGM